MYSENLFFDSFFIFRVLRIRRDGDAFVPQIVPDLFVVQVGE